jgi:hypothetical protein
MTLAEIGIIVQLIVSGGGELNTGDIDNGFLWRRYPNGVCERIDISQYLKTPKVSAWINAYDMLNMTEQYYLKQGWVVTNAGANDKLCKAVNGTDTQGLYAPVAIQTTITSGTLTDSAGGVWSLGTAVSTGGNSLMLNGVATGGFGKQLTLSAGKVYTLTLQNTWYVWTGTNWVSSAQP